MQKRTIAGLTVFAVAGGALVAGVAGASTAPRYSTNMTTLAATETVTPGNLQGWYTEGGSTANPSALPAFSTTKPRGPQGSVASLEFDTQPGSGPGAKDNIVTQAPTGWILEDLTEVKYDYFKATPVPATTNANPAVVAFALAIDTNGGSPGGFTTLNWEAAYNGGPVFNAWTSVDVTAGKVWSTRQESTVLVTPVTEPAQTPHPFAEYMAKYPKADLVYFGLNQGTGATATVSYADLVTVNGRTANFETNPPTPPPLVNGVPTIAITGAGCGSVDVKVTVPANSNPIRAVIRANDKTFYAPTVGTGQSVTVRLTFKEDSRDPAGVVRADVRTFYQSPVSAEPKPAARRFVQTNCR